MLDARSVKRLVLLAVLGAAVGCIAMPSMAQMGMTERSITSNAVQQAVDSARDGSRQPAGTASKKSRASTDEKKPAQAARKEGKATKEAQKPDRGTPQQATRNPSGIPPAGEQRYVPDEVVIEVAGAMTPQQLGALAQRFRLTSVDSFSFQLGGTTLARLRIPDRRSVTTVVRALETDASVLFAQPNYLYALIETKTPAAPGEADPASYVQEKLRLSEAHQLARGNKVLVAVIDSGIDVSHPDLAGDIADSFDAIGTGVAVHNHGTAIAGGIAAHGRLLGVAPSAQILAIRAFSGTGRADNGTTFAIMKGLDWAVLHGARAINMSFAGPQDPGVTRGLAAAYAKNTILIAASGNKGASSPPLFPAADPNVIAVTSTDKEDQLPAFANRGPYVAVAAPGVDLILLAPNDGVQRMSGTSFSAAYVTGTVALMLERKPGLTPAAARQALMKSARRLEPVDDQSGAGLVDAYQAVLSVAPAEATETIVTPTPAANRQ
ncbi:S8 family serine peptidase [Afipia sp. GAS231]|uniref:S8 family peptidase n=1 Tax=Afipia sp. GAS231 TaxID=1882747 RepID=UPI00087BB252|nr:S8 family serine peptidase [Afipia sp. GAS231]SDN18857.1 Subtilase family protein [Afipia sp. GAS231]